MALPGKGGVGLGWAWAGPRTFLVKFPSESRVSAAAAAAATGAEAAPAASSCSLRFRFFSLARRMIAQSASSSSSSSFPPPPESEEGSARGGAAANRSDMDRFFGALAFPSVLLDGFVGGGGGGDGDGDGDRGGRGGAAASSSAHHRNLLASIGGRSPAPRPYSLLPSAPAAPLMLAVYSLHTKSPHQIRKKTQTIRGKQAVASTNLMEKAATTAMDVLRSGHRKSTQVVIEGERRRERVEGREA